VNRGQAFAEPASVQQTLRGVWLNIGFGRPNDCGAIWRTGARGDPYGKVHRWNGRPGARPGLGKSQAGEASRSRRGRSAGHGPFARDDAVAFFFGMTMVASKSNDPATLMQTVGTVSGVVGALGIVLAIFGVIGQTP
jgi:hypothetical protein